jgi:hypothetical protein
MNDTVEIPKGGDDALLAGLDLRPTTGDEEQAERASAAELSEDDPQSRSQFKKLFEATSELDFFASDGEPYISPGKSLAVPLESRRAEQHIRLAYYEKFDRPPSTENLKKFIDIRAAQLSIHGRSSPVFRRVGRVGDRYFLDLCQGGRVVEMTADGWKILNAPKGVYFLRRGDDNEALPTPEPGGNVMSLKAVINVTEPFLKLLVGYLVCSLRPGFPYVVLVLEGEAGSGKSTLARILKYLVDPCRELIRAMPGSERDFAVYAHNSHLLALDNLDRITPGQSDMLCRAATGGGFASRTHYSMTGETVISIQRPVIVTGIEGLVDRADMADRVALVQLELVSAGERMPEANLWPLVEEIRPQVLGGLLDAFCAGLRGQERVRLRRLPRMADFAKFATAAEDGLPWPQGDVLNVYYRSRENLFEQALDKDRVAVAVVRLMEQRALLNQFTWEGTAAELLEVLEPPYGGEDRWPSKPSTVGIRVTKALPLLRGRGITVTKIKSGSVRKLHFSLSKNPSHPSHLSQTQVKPSFQQGQVEIEPVPPVPPTCPNARRRDGSSISLGTGPEPTCPTANPVDTTERDGWDGWDRSGDNPEGDLSPFEPERDVEQERGREISESGARRAM